MDANQRRVIAIAAYVIAVTLFVIYFGRPFWEWATWSQGDTVDLGFLKVNVRPPFPDDARSIFVGVVIPVALAALGRVIQGGRRAGAPD